MNLDRMTQLNRPGTRPVGYQRWDSLLFLHWRVPPDLLRSVLPSDLELDLYDGEAYIGVVPFAMRHIRPWWCPRALGLNFLETNVRTYVHDGAQTGVYFFSLDADSSLAVSVARKRWSLPYYNAKMEMQRTGSQIHYSTSRKGEEASLTVDYTIGATLGPSEPGSREFFFLERYLLFTKCGERLHVGQVHHSPYPAHAASVEKIDMSLLAAAHLGQDWGMPDYAHYSPGVDVDIFPLTPT